MGEWRYGYTILNLDTRRKCVASFTPQPLYLRGKRAPSTHWRECGIGPTAEKNLLPLSRNKTSFLGVLLTWHLYFYSSLKKFPHGKSLIFHEFVFVVISCTLIFVPQNYWVFGLCPSASILKTDNKIFWKLDLFPSLGEWGTVVPITQQF
jgi:hypothetical protein